LPRSELKFSAFASDLDFPASIAFLAFTAAIAVRARHSGARLAVCVERTFSGKLSKSVTGRAVPVAGGITIEAHMGGHATPPTRFRDCDRV
jgi:hypothetical protein